MLSAIFYLYCVEPFFTKPTYSLSIHLLSLIFLHFTFHLFSFASSLSDTCSPTQTMEKISPFNPSERLSANLLVEGMKAICVGDRLKTGRLLGQSESPAQSHKSGQNCILAFCCKKISLRRGPI